MDSFTELRRKYIGSSDVGPILGVCSWASKYDIFLQKLGLKEIETTERMQTGIDIEAWIITERYLPAMAEANADVRVVKPPLLVHPKYPWFGVHCDGLVYPMYSGADRYIQVITLEGVGGGVQIMATPLCGLEIKNVQIKVKKDWGDPGTDQIPATYYWQVQACMEVTDIDVWDVAVFFSGNRFEIFRVHRDREAMARAIPILEELWNRVQTNNPPPIDASESANKFLSTWYQEEEDVEITADLDIDNMATKYFEAKAERNRQIGLMVECENAICKRMESAPRKAATKLIGPDYGGTWKFEPRRKVDYKAIIEEAGVKPELIAKHTTKPKPKKRTFRLKQRAQEENQ